MDGAYNGGPSHRDVLVTGYDSTSTTSNKDGSVLERLEYIAVAIGGATGQLRFNQSVSGTVEENQFMPFSIGLVDIDTGAIAVGNIGVGSMVVEMARSRAGGAFSAVGITQPTFTAATGTVSTCYQFLAAEWQIGDVYRCTVSGITVTFGTETAYVPTMTWTNMVMEGEDIDTNVETILGDTDHLSRVAIPTGWTLNSLYSFIVGSTLLGSALPESTSLYDTTKNVNQVGITAAPVANTLADTLHKDGTFAYDNTTDSLEAISDKVTDVNTDLGNFSGQTNLQSALAVLGVPDVAGKDLYTCLITDRLDNATYGLSALETLVDDIETEMAKVPKSDSTVTWNATALGSINAEVDTALNTIVPAAPTAGSLNDILSKASGGNTFDKATDSLEALSDSISSGTQTVTAGTGSSQTNVRDILFTQTDNYWRGSLLVCTAGDNLGQGRIVTSFAAATDDFVVSEPFYADPTGDTFVLISGYGLKGWLPQADVPVNIVSTDDAETNVFDLSTTGISYKVNSLRIKSADPTGPDVVKVRLWELINDVLTEVDYFEITTSNYGTWYSLMDMFGVTHLAGDNLKVTVQTTTGTTHVAVTGQYSYDLAITA